mmetsp:Transcript_2905/g.4470  ORF Transcript_2905/g.4470 Transcript_2905/m.4470 type:complete len:225 (-) Transcript_2905:307-981(-)
MHQRHVGPAVARERAPAGDPALLLLLGGLVPRGAGVGQAGAARGAVQPQPPLAVHVQPEVHGPAAPLALAANLLEERGGVVVVRPDPELQRAVVGVLEPQALLVRHLHVPPALEVDVPVGLRLGVPVQPEAAVRVQPRGAELEQPQAPAPGDGGGDQAPDARPPVRHHEEQTSAHSPAAADPDGQRPHQDVAAERAREAGVGAVEPAPEAVVPLNVKATHVVPY